MSHSDSLMKILAYAESLNIIPVTAGIAYPLKEHVAEGEGFPFYTYCVTSSDEDDVDESRGFVHTLDFRMVDDYEGSLRCRDFLSQINRTFHPRDDGVSGVDYWSIVNEQLLAAVNRKEPITVVNSRLQSERVYRDQQLWVGLATYRIVTQE